MNVEDLMRSLSTIEFPYKRLFLHSPEYYFDNLVKNDYVTRGRRHVRHDWTFPPDSHRTTIEFISSDNSYDECDIIADLYTEDIRIRSRLRGKYTSFEWFNYYRDVDPTPLISAALQIDTLDPICALREAMYQLIPEATQFKASLAKAVYEALAADLDTPVSDLDILDFCSGWGDRLFGALSANVKSYTGIDPNTLLHPAYVRIKHDFPGVDTRFFNCPAEDFESTDKFDVIFTSTPFNDYEQYFSGTDNDARQCNVKYSCDRWAEEWLFPIASKMMTFLKPGGVLALHLNDMGSSACPCKELTRYMTRMGYPLYGTMAYHRRHRRPIPIWVWKASSTHQTNFLKVSSQ
jgi:hypothetical protein